jgi:enoyl-CoA hydratase/carnithine racemase
VVSEELHVNCAKMVMRTNTRGGTGNIARFGSAAGEEDTMMETALRVERRGPVVVLENHDPPRNRMTFEYMDELERAVIALRDDRDTRAVVITAAGDEHFSVGMDLKQLMSGAQARGGFEAVLDQRLRVLSLIEQLDKPVIATMFGYCLGGGLELPLACHFRLAAAEGARIGLPELDLGTVPAWGGTARLTRTVGRANALDMILRAKKIDGPTALAIGLVHELHPVAELKTKAVELAEELAAQPPIAVAGVLRAVVGAEHLPLEDALRIERDAVRRCSSSADQTEGMTAFLEKRRPRFQGR